MSPETDEPTGESREVDRQDPPPDDAALNEAERKFLAARAAFIEDQEAKRGDQRRS